MYRMISLAEPQTYLIYACVGILQNSLQWQNTSKSSAAPQVTSVSLQISAANLHTATSSKQSSFENFSFIPADTAIATPDILKR